MLVLPELNALIGVWPAHLAVEADVRDMPGIWVSADHQVFQYTLPSMTCRSLVALFIILYSSAPFLCIITPACEVFCHATCLALRLCLAF